MAEFRTDITADPAQFNAAMEAMAQKAMTESQHMQSAMREAFLGIGISAGKAAADSEAAVLRIDVGFKGVSQAIKTQFDGVAAVLRNTMMVMTSIGAAVAGGAMFKAIIDSTTQWASEVSKLSKVLGTTTEAASVYAIALKLIGKTSEEYGDAAFKLLRQIKSNEQALNDMGLATKVAATGGIRPMTDLMSDAIKLMGQYKEGADRDAFAIYAFGRSGQEMMAYMRLNEQVMTRANELATQYNLKVGKEGVEASKAYKMEQAAVGIMFDAIKEKIGAVVMPAFTALAGYFSEIGPAAISIFTFGLKHIIQFFEETVLIVRVVYENIADFFERMGTSFGALAGAIQAFLSGNWKGMADAWGAAQDDIKRTHADRVATVERVEREANERLRKLWEGADPMASVGKAEPKGTLTFKMPAKHTAAVSESIPDEKSHMGQFEEDLAAERDAFDKKKLLEGSFQTYSLAMERDYWKKILDAGDLTTEEQIAVSRKYYSLELQLRKEAFEADMAGIKERIARHKAGSLERIQLAGEEAFKIGEKYGVESKEYRVALGEMSKMAEERGKQQQQLDAMMFERTKESKVAVIELERQALDDAEKLGLINADQKLARLKQLSELQYQIDLQTLTDTAALYEMDAVAYQQHLDKLAKLKQTYALNAQKLDGQVTAESKKTFDALFDPIGNGFAKLMDSMIAGTQTWSQAIHKALLAVGAEFLSEGVKIAVHWAKTELLKTQATVTGVAMRGAAEEAGAVESVLISAGSAITVIATKAWEAAASTYAAIAQIPYVGPYLAPAAAALALAAVLAFAGNIASAEGGFSVPRGLSPITRLHENEMVLPASIANPLRDSLADGNASAGGSMDTFNIHVVDKRGVEQLLMGNGPTLAKSLRAQARNFSPVIWQRK
jgi:hypothetical protein